MFFELVFGSDLNVCESELWFLNVCYEVWCVCFELVCF